MALSNTARRILAEAAQHPLRLAAPPEKPPIAATRAVLTNLLKQSYVETCEAPGEFAGLRWHQQDGTRPAVRIAEAGLAAISATSATAVIVVPDQAQDAGTSPRRRRPGAR